MTHYEIGKTYEIMHARKGYLTVCVERVTEDWIDATIVEGTEKRMSGYGAGPGETLRFRASLTTIVKEIS
nr:hypothetical protein [uncultured Celeribacter sp.]